MALRAADITTLRASRAGLWVQYVVLGWSHSGKNPRPCTRPIRAIVLVRRAPSGGTWASCPARCWTVLLTHVPADLLTERKSNARLHDYFLFDPPSGGRWPGPRPGRGRAPCASELSH